MESARRGSADGRITRETTAGGSPRARTEAHTCQTQTTTLVDETADRVGEINRREVVDRFVERGDEVAEEADAPAGSP